MTPRLATSLVLVLALLAHGSSAAGQTPPATPAAAPAATPAADPTAATPQNVAAFLGDWTLAAQGPNGPSTFELSIKTDAGKVAAEIASEVQGKQPVATISKTATGLVLKYGFDYQGMAIPAVVTLTPAGDKVGVQIDFADGAYVLEGTATKKK